ncbi:MAG: hypothetical protein KF808_06855 [Cryobacterium sp.]|nr:hypothetical protein [Cryobacterium sp.]
MTNSTRQRSVLIAIGVVAILAIIAAIVLLNQPRATVQPGPGAGPGAEPAPSTPQPVFAVECEELVPPEFREAIWGVPGEAVDPTARWNFKIGVAGFYTFSNIQSGANDCRWEGPAEFDFSKNGSDGIQSIEIIISPDLQGGYAAIQDSYFAELYAKGANCLESGAYCNYQNSIPGAVLTLEVDGIAAADFEAAKALVNERIKSIAGAIEKADRHEPWAAPAGTATVSACAEVATAEQFNAARILPIAFRNGSKDGIANGFRILSVEDPYRSCSYSPGEVNESTILNVAVLSGGEWAFAIAKAATSENSDRSTFELEGTSADVPAEIVCSAEYHQCRIDFVVAHTWVKVELMTDLVQGRAPDEEARKIAAIIAANLSC